MLGLCWNLLFLIRTITIPCRSAEASVPHSHSGSQIVEGSTIYLKATPSARHDACFSVSIARGGKKLESLSLAVEML